MWPEWYWYHTSVSIILEQCSYSIKVVSLVIPHLCFKGQEAGGGDIADSNWPKGFLCHMMLFSETKTKWKEEGGICNWKVNYCWQVVYIFLGCFASTCPLPFFIKLTLFWCTSFSFFLCYVFFPPVLQRTGVKKWIYGLMVGGHPRSAHHIFFWWLRSGTWKSERWAVIGTGNRHSMDQLLPMTE